MSTRGSLKAKLAAQVGDVLTTGSPAFLQGSGFKYAEHVYNNAIDFAIELVREMFMIPQQGVVTWPTNGSQYDITPPTDMVYVHEMKRSTLTGGTLFEKMIPLDIVNVTRQNSVAQLHLDNANVSRLDLNLSGANVLVKGYQYQTIPANDAATVSINEATLLAYAKSFVHQSGVGRDPSESLKNMRQAEQSFGIGERLLDRTGQFPIDGGIWLDDI